MSMPAWAVLVSLAMMAVTTHSMYVIEKAHGEDAYSARPVSIGVLTIAFYLALMVVVFAFFDCVVEPVVDRISSGEFPSW